jgi:phage terminase small subunit
MRSNRPRANPNGAQFQVATLRSAATAADRLAWPAIVPPAPDPLARATELELMGAILAARAPTDWSPLDVIIVARLAAAMAALMKDEESLRAAGSLVRSGQGGDQVKRNPMIDVVATRSALVHQLMRQLGLSVPRVDRQQFAAAARVIDKARIFDKDDADGLFA